MSAAATPIPPERFAEAIVDLPLANLHFKAAELRNSISHLESSNSQLQHFADEGDTDCTDAIRENEETMMRMEERVLLLRREVERRGFQWGEDADMRSANTQTRISREKEGKMETEESTGFSQPANGVTSSEQQPSSTGRTMGNEEMARRLRQRLDEREEDEENGIHL